MMLNGIREVRRKCRDLAYQTCSINYFFMKTNLYIYFIIVMLAVWIVYQ